MESKASILTLRLLLFAGAIGWACPVILLFFPKSLIMDILTAKGLNTAITDPMLYYWFFMAIATWGIVGFLFLMPAWRIEYYFNIIPLLAIGSLFQGFVLFIAGFLMKIAVIFYIWDVLFCLFSGAVILYLRQKLKKYFGE